MYLFNQEFKSNIMSCMLCLRKSFMSSHSRQDLCFFLWHLLVFYHFFLLYTSKSGLAQVHMLAAEQGKVEEHLYHRIQYTSSTHNLPFLPSKSAVDYSSLHTVWHVRGTGGSLSPILISLSAHLVEPALGNILSFPPPLCSEWILLKGAPDVFYSLLYPSGVKLQSGLLILSSLE